MPSLIQPSAVIAHKARPSKSKESKQAMGALEVAKTTPLGTSNTTTEGNKQRGRTGLLKHIAN